MIVLTGPSASGKTATCLYLQEHYGIKKVITHTTRMKRVGEVDDVDYHFVSVEEFLKLKEEGAFIESVYYNGNYYGTSKDEVKLDKCLAVELNGAKTYRSLNDPHIVLFYMKAKEETRKERMEKRGDEEVKIVSRIDNDRQAFLVDEEMNGLIDDTVDTECLNIAGVAKYIYLHYISILKERGVDTTDLERDDLV